MEFDDFQRLLASCQSEQDSARRQAVEKEYFDFKQQHPGPYSSFMLHIICSDGSQASYAAVLFRRDIEQSGESAALYRAFSKEEAHQAVVRVLQWMTEHPTAPQIRLLGEVIGVHLEMSFSSDGNLFPEFFQCLQHCFSTPDTIQLRAVFMNSLKYVCSSCYSGIKRFGEQNLYSIIEMGLRDPSDAVAAAASSCVSALVSYADPDAEDLGENLDDTIPARIAKGFVGLLISRIEPMVVNGPTSLLHAEKALENFVEIIDINGELIKDFVDPIYGLTRRVLSTEGVDESLKRLCVLAFSYLCENVGNIKKKARTQIQDILLNYIMPFTGLFDDDLTPDWLAAADAHNFDDMNGLMGYSEDALDRISNALGYKIIMPVITDFVKCAAAAPTIHNCYAVANVFSICAEGISRLVSEKDLEFFVSTLSQLSRHDHPRVRYSVINAFGQMADDYAPDIQELHSQIMPVLITLAGDSCPQVAAHSPAAIMNFIESFKQEQVYLYYEQLIAMTTYHLTQTTSLQSNTNALAIISSLATLLVKADFERVCENFLPHILGRFSEVMTTLQSATNTTLNAAQINYVQRLLECLSIVADRVPRLFDPYVDPLLQAIMQLFKFSVDDAECTLLKASLIAIMRIANSSPVKLGTYLEAINERLTAILEMEYISIRDTESLGADDDSGLVLNPHVLQLKVITFSVYANIMENAPAAFAPYLTHLLTNITNKKQHISSVSERTKSNCFECLCYSMRVAVADPVTCPPALVHAQVFPLILDAAKAYTGELETYSSMAECLSEYVETYCKYAVKQNDASAYQETVRELFSTLEYIEKEACTIYERQLTAFTDDDEYEEEELKQLKSETMDDLADVIAALSDVYGTFAKAMGDASLDVITAFVIPTIDRWIMQSTPKVGKKGRAEPMNELLRGYFTSAISVVTDIIEYLTPASSKGIVDKYATAIIASTKPEPGQFTFAHIGSYATGLMFEKYDDPTLATLIPQLMENAHTTITYATSGQYTGEDLLHARDNAVTMLARMAARFPGEVGRLAGGEAAFWKTWFGLAKQIRSDSVEVLASVRIIVGGFQRNDPCFIGDSLPAALETFLALYFGKYHDTLTEKADLKAQVDNVLSQLENSGTLLQTALAGASEYVQKTYAAYRKQ